MSSSRYSESVIYTEAELSEMERNRKLLGTISKRLDNIEKDVVRRVSYNRDEIDLIRQRIDNGHQMQITLFDSLGELRKEIEGLKGTRPTEVTSETGNPSGMPTSPLLPAAERLYHVSNVFNLTNN
jgi:hypothetical protein